MAKNNDNTSQKKSAHIIEHLATTETIYPITKDMSPAKASKDNNRSAQLLLATYLNRYRRQIIKRKRISS